MKSRSGIYRPTWHISCNKRPSGWASPGRAMVAKPVRGPQNRRGGCEVRQIRLIGGLVVSVEERQCQVTAKSDDDGLFFGQ